MKFEDDVQGMKADIFIGGDTPSLREIRSIE